MNLAFYYHIPITPKNGVLTVPSYLGVFIDSIASEVDTLFLVMHEPRRDEATEADYEIKSKNIVWINLGKKTAAWHRALFHNKILTEPLKQIEVCDAFLIRSPTPLSPYFARYIKKTKPVFMVVGDYAESVEQAQVKTFREWVIMKYLSYNDYLFRKAMKATDIIVNSPALFKKYQSIAKSTYQIKTTTLSLQDIFDRSDTCSSSPLNILYTGRIDPLKGLFELVEAFAMLSKSRSDRILHFVGWETAPGRPVENNLLAKAKTLGVADKIIFHGRKSVGPELNKMYRMADIYVIPSYEEGFPRTIWEAMANGLPVIATKVGAIPEYLTHKENAYLIPSRNTNAIVEAINEISSDASLRQALIAKGKQISKENTLEIQSKKLVSIIKEIIR